MIHAVLIFNNQGKPRLTKFYNNQSPSSHRSNLTSKIYQLILNRSNTSTTSTNLISIDSDRLNWFYNNKRQQQKQKQEKKEKLKFFNDDDGVGAGGKVRFEGESRRMDRGLEVRSEVGEILGDGTLNVVYRNYATLYFVFVIDRVESELAILDLIQVFVESLDQSFKNVCELDLIFNYDELNLLLNQVIIGGIVIDTCKDSIVSNFKNQLRNLKNSKP
ncbi:AP complex, mu/sigma subunit [Phakopsora pachyrhizi]|uniref:AP complex, mu/sigma subunit n=1 Tax=Phakopsora pachyrhizi TaxID=170000 RepID=A0AAV0BK82_PHAPC|nr:AP complex, mu/sigma subunit [Phakopsora pachyrhizi]